MSFGIEELQGIHSGEGIGWDPQIYQLLAPHASELTLLRHTTAHGTADDCLKILAECGYPSDGSIIPVVTQIGTMKFPVEGGEAQRQQVMVSHYGADFLDPVRKAMAVKFGTSAKSGKEFMRTIVENGKMVDLIGVPEGVSSPLIPTAKYSNFARVGMVLDQQIPGEVLAIAASRNTTLLIPRTDFETVISFLAEVEPRLVLLRFPPEP
jgi:hypothetical protein